MIKTELLKLIEALGDNDNVLESLQGIEGLAKSSELDIQKLSIEDYKSILENNKEIKGYTISSMDSAISKAILSHDEKFNKEKLPKLIEDAIKAKSLEGLSPLELEVRELKQQLEQQNKEKTRTEGISKLQKALKEKNLPDELADFIYGDGNEEIINANTEFFSNLITNSVNNGVKERLGNRDETPPKNEQLNEEELLDKQMKQAMGIR